MLYHIRILILGVPILAVFAGVIYLMTLLPLWLAEAPFLAIMAYAFGKAIELWAQS